MPAQQQGAHICGQVSSEQFVNSGAWPQRAASASLSLSFYIYIKTTRTHALSKVHIGTNRKYYNVIRVIGTSRRKSIDLGVALKNIYPLFHRVTYSIAYAHMLALQLENLLRNPLRALFISLSLTELTYRMLHRFMSHCYAVTAQDEYRTFHLSFACLLHFRIILPPPRASSPFSTLRSVLSPFASKRCMEKKWVARRARALPELYGEKKKKIIYVYIYVCNKVCTSVCCNIII